MSKTLDSLQFYLRYTTEEEKLIDKHLPFYVALDKGKRIPNTEKQKHFVRFCKGQEQANTPHEFAYLKYKRIQAYEEKQRNKLRIANNSAINNNVQRNTKINKLSSSHSSRGYRQDRLIKSVRDYDDSPASAREILQAQDKAMKLQSSKRVNIRKAMAVHSDPKD